MKYKVFYHEVTTELNTFVSAGLELIDQNGKVYKRYYDVSTDFEAFNDFVTRLNESDISPQHIESLLDDYYLKHY